MKKWKFNIYENEKSKIAKSIYTLGTQQSRGICRILQVFDKFLGILKFLRNCCEIIHRIFVRCSAGVRFILTKCEKRFWNDQSVLKNKQERALSKIGHSLIRNKPHPMRGLQIFIVLSWKCPAMSQKCFNLWRTCPEITPDMSAKNWIELILYQKFINSDWRKRDMLTCVRKKHILIVSKTANAKIKFRNCFYQSSYVIVGYILG